MVFTTVVSTKVVFSNEVSSNLLSSSVVFTNAVSTNVIFFSFSTQHVSTLDVLFSKAKVTKAVHVDIGQGTNFDVKIPWIIGESGYQTKLNGTLMVKFITCFHDS